jgi:hypothetical protein
MHSSVFGGDPFDQTPHILLRRVHLSEITDLATTIAIGNCDCVVRPSDINPNEKLFRMIHGLVLLR